MLFFIVLKNKQIVNIADRITALSFPYLFGIDSDIFEYLTFNFHGSIMTSMKQARHENTCSSDNAICVKYTAWPSESEKKRENKWKINL
ncbi:hypothetical protein CLOSYM_03293 [[Clostridium] symbiosum ATCC 14940]|uniref:Uncharacterized protein n=1 Tax=[Clostridium] symbiosum ATCC 14940 TaxID=411472 RepID=A0ABC9TVC5_CLOSY|nr:hypothetical protein CLOSYM_03293 [[Clostridium] symbiosum ATCC 14940]